jgi:hypothetical protein
MAKRGKGRVHVASPEPSLLKRQATLQILVRADGKQMRMAIVFKGKGVGITEEEKMLLEELDIDVYWQKKAWVDADIVKHWLVRSMAEAIKDTPGEHLLLCDNLKGQDIRPMAGSLGRCVKQLALDHRIRMYNHLAGCTDEVQVVDAGVGSWIKSIISTLTEIWLNSMVTLTLWTSSSKAGGLSTTPQNITNCHCESCESRLSAQALQLAPAGSSSGHTWTNRAAGAEGG